MRPSSAKNKGRLFQVHVAKRLQETAQGLEPDDIRSTAMGVTGEDIQMSPAARRVYPIAFECKKVEKLNIWEAIAQAKSHAKDKYKPAVAFSRNFEEAWVAIPLEYFLELIHGKK